MGFFTPIYSIDNSGKKLNDDIQINRMMGEDFAKSHFCFFVNI